MVVERRTVELAQLGELGAGEAAELAQDVQHHAVAAALAAVGDLEGDAERHRPAHRQAVEPLGPFLAQHPAAGSPPSAGW